MKLTCGTRLLLALSGVSLAFGNAVIMVGPVVNVSKLAGNQAESTISVNPTNTMDLFASDTISNVGRFSLDGGLTWSNSNLSALPGSLGDVQTAWDQYGNLFLTRFGPNQTIIVARSSDGGATFGDVRTVGVAANNDQPSIAVGKNSVWVDFATANFQMVAAGAQVTGFNAVGGFGSLVSAPGTPRGDFGDIAIGPAGQVALVYQDNGSGSGPDTVKFNLNATGLGGTFGAQSIVTSTNVGGFASVPPQPSRTIDAEANLAWDASGGPHNGRLYMVYVDRVSTASTDTDIFERFSDDNGSTWSAPVRVNDDASGRTQMQPAIALDQTTGDIAITWYDARNSSADNMVEVFGAVSDNGGLSFGPNFQISAALSSCLVDVGSFDCGDYDKMTFSGGKFWRTWADSSNSTGDNPDGTGALDIYTASVTVSSAVPEPGAWLLVGGGAVMLAAIRQRRNRAV